MIEFQRRDGSPVGELFGPLSGNDNVNGAVDYEHVLIVNTGTHRLIGGTVWAEKQPGGAAIQIAFALGDAPPEDLRFHEAGSREDGLPMDTLKPGEKRGLWVRRQGMNSDPVEGDRLVLNVAGDVL